MEETKFYENANTLITNKRIVVDWKTFAMGQITSVDTHTTSEETNEETAKNKIIKFFTKIIWWISLFAGFFLWMLWESGWGWFFFIGSIVCLIINAMNDNKWKLNHYHVTLQTSAWAVEAYSNDDEKIIKDVINAINEAIVSR